MSDPDIPEYERGDISPDGRHFWDGDVWQWQPLWMTADEIANAAFQRFGQRVVRVQFLAAGMLNQSWRIDTSTGSYVLRVSRPERSREQVAYEHDFVRSLKEHVKVVVAPLAGIGSDTIQFWREHILSLFPYVEGVVGEMVDPDLRQGQTATVLAQLHRASLNNVDFGQRPGFQPFDDAWRSIWYTAEPVLLRELQGRDTFDDLFDMLESEVASLEAWLGNLDASRRSLVRATIHGDFDPRNLIFRDDCLVAVIDWDECRVDPIAWEVAQVGFGGLDIDSLAFWQTYLDAGGPLQPRDLELMVNFARMDALSELRWTVANDRVKPHVMQQLSEIDTALSFLRQRKTDLGL